MSGCGSLQLHSDTSTHFVVLGFGIVSVPRESDANVVATKVQAIGVTFANDYALKLNAGYVSGATIGIPPQVDDVIVEVSDEIGGPLRITSHAVNEKDKEAD